MITCGVFTKPFQSAPGSAPDSSPVSAASV
jgi:hypothetical protein